MYRHLRIAVLAPCFEEEARIGNVVRRVREWGEADIVLVVDDGSRDDSARAARAAGAEVLALPERRGVGAALREGLRSLRGRADVVVVIAGNDKDEPREIPRLLDPIAEGSADFVQGSRYLSGGRASGDMPLYRRFATRLHPLLFSISTGRKVTESTNGFRAFRLSLLEDPRVKLEASSLDGYALEPHLYASVLRLGYPTCEVAVTKTYPPRKLGYTKMKAGRDWWEILRPLFLR